MEANRGVTNLVLKKDNLNQEFFHTPIPTLSMQFNSFLLFSRKSIMKLILTSLAPPRSMMLNARLGFYVLDEVSKESKVIAKYHIT